MRRGRTFWAQSTLSTQRARLRLLQRKAKGNSNKYNNARVAEVEGGRTTAGPRARPVDSLPGGPCNNRLQGGATAASKLVSYNSSGMQ
jgi:hypothetical protein